MTLYISVNRQTAVNNATYNQRNPIYEVRRSKNDPNPRTYGSCSIPGNNIRCVYDPENPLISGAFAWIEIDET